MDSAPPPQNDPPPLTAEAERQRLEALSRYHGYGALRGAAFDDLARLAAYVCQTPISLVSLVDSRRQWFLSSAGVDICESSRDVSFCAHALIGPDMLIVPDAQADARFADNPLVWDEPFIRFYAGAPLVTSDGYTLGTLCVIDHVPRILTRAQKDALTSLSRLAVTQLDMLRLKQSLPDRS
jgi:GAF domain-containing protein